MNHDQAVLNRVWCHTLLEELARNGVEHVCVAPGSRSTPLTLEAEANPKLTLHTHFDERGLGFLALGLAKASNKPVAVIVTSGTAVANLLPATAESGLTREKLILLTSDRPIDLVDCGANQAIQQQGIFSSHVETALNLPSPTTQVSLNWLLTSVDSALAKQCNVGGAIHINCPFPEPLYSKNSAEMYADYTKSIAGWSSSANPYSNTCLPNHLTVQPVAPGDYLERKGAVIIGSIDKEAATKAQQFASALGWLIFCDPQSGVNSDWKHYDLWLQSDSVKEQLNQCDFILQFGERIVSKRLNQWIKSQAAWFDCTQYVVVSPDAHRINQDHLPQTHIVANIESWITDQHLPTLLGKHSGWATPLIEVANTVQQLALAQISNNDQLTELSVAVDLSSRLKDRELFVGNSLMVRLVDMLSSISANRVYSNRGASGIDGLVATAAGVVKANQNPLLMLIGDTSLLYDINSLALLTHNLTPMVIVVTNNDGGAIFDLLPVPEQQKQSLYQMPHGFSFEHAAAQFQLGYAAPETLNCYQTIIEQHFEQGQGTLLVEVKTPPEQASTLLKQFSSMLTEALA
ncbi:MULTISPECIES: 2-succinyl-5-enolpyruvyl-6-hydroxy-3-cyclohexene-1-carboxylic-acid synthase [unclassified Vibrio]|uniref:2-succinyl-5-enolpyruvyl-6-hydroxy-3- cyclohexene-1-carboxylic-acid synthase n=1 Tax=unclassified Vibrio TaxID=2614977 RepID=UPI000C82A893|nr:MULTISPECIES: 2-succinyl-5-enolpyruvyl-6-hydroxy-3-cyclohexene-1-carboxylic-acid synthase [unclassified Vibrio]PMI23753.1 2-succinyl-5-enolpyruvyl-6-hydroxy-3-cyclohexene-1-carboxylic-acid synthase [Vibrio sp. 10N.286.46.E10]PTO93428.1 2-succinyl-5-enolpyruvyl-6-hydroxy-3-cyclohexene-1-carboxylic-acid synthase [Vibrio sp. 10N.286.48.B8]PTP11043.1 2-succinyl-5-enolpyruvyl-6-hydroxy-3-cyclohexene-1-carboxylic-acid synthase [Vibrio sp. 10N.286.45.A3]PTQ24298.1 2-succinyl-5-enolpyruvyl-6-hydroxy